MPTTFLYTGGHWGPSATGEGAELLIPLEDERWKNPGRKQLLAGVLASRMREAVTRCTFTIF